MPAQAGAARRKQPLTANVYAMTARHTAEFLGMGYRRFVELVAAEATFPRPRRLFEGHELKYLRDEVVAWCQSRPAELERWRKVAA